MPGQLTKPTRDELNSQIQSYREHMARDRDKLTRLNTRESKLRAHVQREKARVERLKLERQTLPPQDTPRQKALALALSYVGTVESPAGSNGGPRINEWEDRFHMGRGPWCGAFIGAMAEQGGGANVSDRIVYTPNILVDAQAGQYGLRRVLWTDSGGWATSQHYAPIFSLCLFDFVGGSSLIKHVGALRETWKGSGLLKTCEGNTSFGDGSQDNGGAVARKERDPILLRAIVALEWPGKF